MFKECTICHSREKIQDTREEYFVFKNNLELRKTNTCFRICSVCVRKMKESIKDLEGKND